MADTHSILRRLHHERFVSGAQLAAEFHLSRTAIWKHIEAIKAMGIDVFSVKGKGYKLAAPLDLISLDDIRHALPSTLKEDIRFVFEPVLPSTNSYLLQRSRQLANYTLCLCEQQSAGKGRLERHWVSPYAANIYLSLLWKTDLSIASLSASSLVVALSMITALKSSGYDDVEIKWPNDIYKSGKKLAGILIEVNGEVNGIQNAVIGIGLNVRMPEQFAQNIDQEWTDLVEEGKTTPSRNILIAKLMEYLVPNLERFTDKGFADFMDEWAAEDFLYNKAVQVRQHDDVIDGIARGVGNDGSLLLEVDNNIKPVYAGDVSCRLASHDKLQNAD